MGEGENIKGQGSKNAPLSLLNPGNPQNLQAYVPLPFPFENPGPSDQLKRQDLSVQNNGTN
jgi:hypothetical protein